MGGRPDLRIRLLGGLDVDGVDGAALGSRKGRTLLKRLALARGPLPTAQLVDTLWPSGRPPANPAEQVSVLVSRLRRVIGADRITHSDGAYRLHVDWLDIDELAARTAEAERRARDGETTAARAAAAAALALARGPLLPDEPDAEWAELERLAVTRTLARARHVIAEVSLTAGLPFEAAEHAARALSDDPYDETALRLLMLAHATAGRHALALQAYATAAALVADELGADLAPETQALHLELLRTNDLAAAPDPDARPQGLPGRAGELAEVDAAFEKVVASGGAAIVVIDGEAGIGKTRLLDAIADRLGTRAVVLRGRADDVGVLPLEPVLDAIGRRLAAATVDDRDRLLGHDAGLLAPLLGQQEVSTATYRNLLTAQEPLAPDAVPLLHLALLGVVNRLAADRPVALLVDDVHLADASTVRWLELAGHRGRGVLVVAARRADGADLSVSAQRVVLGPLEEAAAADACGLDPASERFRQIYARSGGHPLFLVELARSEGDALPDSIRAVVAGQVADQPAVAETLGGAAVLGNVVDVDLLGGVLQRPTRDLLDDLEHGARRGLLVDGPDGYVFRHDLIRSVLELGVAQARRRWLHAEAARALAGRARNDPMRVAHHARLGGDADLAAQALLDAATAAGGRYEHDEALRLIDESLALADTVAGHLMRGRCLVLLGRYDDARAAAATAGELGGGVAALEVAVHAAYYAREWDRVAELSDEAINAASDPEVAATCSYFGAKAMHAKGALADADRRYRAVLTAPGQPTIRPVAALWLGLLQLHRGRVDSADVLLHRDADQARSTPVLFAEVYVQQIRTHADVLAGRLQQAVGGGRRLAKLVADQHARRFVGRGEVYEAWALSLLGAPAAYDRLTAAHEISKSAGNSEPYCQSCLDLAIWSLNAAQLDVAGEMLADTARALDAGPVSNGWRIVLRHRYLSGVLSALSGDVDGAREAAADVLAVAERESIERFAVKARLLDAEARLIAGDAVDVDAIAPDINALAEVARPDGWRITARLARRTGSDQLRQSAIEAVNRLRDGAGDHRADLERLADEVLF
ncbi:MAG TPA: AAA family ATPase [Mycobacteriales bacterium]|nr:AAA family ATPase [Mycobacteriales bacterium]